MVLRSRFALVLVVVGLLASACGTATTPTPTAAPTATATAAPTATPTAAPTATPTAAPSIVATVPADQLIFHGKLVICSDMPYPPLEYFDEEGNPLGSDIEMGAEIGRRLGLTMEVVNSVFDTIIPALTGGRCDIIISFQNINDERLGQVDMILYYEAGQAFLVQAGNPANIQAIEDL